MNKMFIKIEYVLSSLHPEGRTPNKAWIASHLGESPQNLNNWIDRRIPPAKVKSIAKKLGVSRSYLEDDSVDVEDVNHGLGGIDHDGIGQLSSSEVKWIEIIRQLTDGDKFELSIVAAGLLASQNSKT